MMYRRTEDEEESGSDWDELTPPRTTPEVSPAVHSQVESRTPPPFHESSFSSTTDDPLLAASSQPSVSGARQPGAGHPGVSGARQPSISGPPGVSQGRQFSISQHSDSGSGHHSDSGVGQPVGSRPRQSGVTGAGQHSVSGPSTSSPIDSASGHPTVSGSRQPSVSQPLDSSSGHPAISGARQPSVSQPFDSSSGHPAVRQPSVSQPFDSGSGHPAVSGPRQPSVVQTRQPSISQPSDSGSGHHSESGATGQPRIPPLLIQEPTQSTLVQTHTNLQGLQSDALRPQGLVSQAMKPEGLNLQGYSAHSVTSQALSSMRTEHLPPSLSGRTEHLPPSLSGRTEHLPPSLSGRTEHLPPSLSGRTEHLPPSLSGHGHMETGFGGDSAQTFEDGLMSIATAKTPNPPPPKTPPSAKSVYRVRLEGEGLEEGGERPGASPQVQRGQHGGRDEKNAEYIMDLEFTSVCGQQADYLSPAHHPPQAYMTRVANKWEEHSQRCVEECCSSVRLVSDFLIALILGSAHCLLNHGFRKLCCGLGHLLSDSLFKPLVTLCFNGFMWPVMAALVQLSRGVVLVIGPLLEIVGVLMSWVVQVVRNCRLVLINNKTYQVPTHKPQHEI